MHWAHEIGTHGFGRAIVSIAAYYEVGDAGTCQKGDNAQEGDSQKGTCQEEGCKEKSRKEKSREEKLVRIL